eukprot:TRINITY_DN4536_c0_g1_i1.p2 TRINITY_DN4536_c0_g1~~TRINITY_DN4536_c0_g1_i1.p2  ORF type:complete len:180 (+),score=27.43 TRINITY_DN4536_c0_g1_i1:58-597(+)
MQVALLLALLVLSASVAADSSAEGCAERIIAQNNQTWHHLREQFRYQQVSLANLTFEGAASWTWSTSSLIMMYGSLDILYAPAGFFRPPAVPASYRFVSEANCSNLDLEAFLCRVPALVEEDSYASAACSAYAVIEDSSPLMTPMLIVTNVIDCMVTLAFFALVLRLLTVHGQNIPLPV